MRKTLYWLPRVLGIAFVVFISLFALDVFNGEDSLSYQMLAFLIHMIPSFILIALLLVAWKWQLVGGILYIIAGLIYLIFTGGMPLLVYVIICGPAFLIGALFISNHFVEKKASPSAE
jgi:hypothetical protein